VQLSQPHENEPDESGGREHLEHDWALFALSSAAVAPKNGTSAIFGPIPINKSRNVSMTNSKSADGVVHQCANSNSGGRRTSRSRLEPR
jgi:hypothetical protein